MTRRASEGWKWRVQSDYLGAGTFTSRDGLILLNTDEGVQAVDPTGRERWRARLGSRCLGVHLFKGGQEAVAACLDGLYVLDASGQREWGTHSKKEVIHDPVLYREGLVLCTVHSVHYLRDWKGPEWRFDLREALGPSVKSVRMIDAFELEGLLVLGAVDYDSGIGRVVVLDEKGHRRWQSDPGPLSALFPAGSAVFVWSLCGYGEFESRMSRPDGKEIWRLDFAGAGAVHPDGTISMLVGSNEAPAWDDWEYRRLSPAGRVEMTASCRGHCTSRPLVASDGKVYFTGYTCPFNPNESRTDYTSFRPLPSTLAFGHKTGLSVLTPKYHLFFQRVSASGVQEVLGEESDSLSFSRPVELEDVVVFTSRGTLIAYPKG